MQWWQDSDPSLLEAKVYLLHHILHHLCQLTHEGTGSYVTTQGLVLTGIKSLLYSLLSPQP